MSKFRSCPACGADRPLVRETRKATYRYKGTSIEIPQDGEWCQVCGEGILSHRDIRANERRLVEWRDRVDREIAPFVKKVRKKLGLTQEEMAAIVGGGKKAFAKYESGTVVPSEAMVNLIRLLDKHPKLLADLRPARRAA